MGNWSWVVGATIVRRLDCYERLLRLMLYKYVDTGARELRECYTLPILSTLRPWASFEVME